MIFKYIPIIFLITFAIFRADAQTPADTVLNKLQSIEKIEQRIDYLNSFIRTNTHINAIKMLPYQELADKMVKLAPLYRRGQTELIINKIRILSFTGKADSALILRKGITLNKLSYEHQAWLYYAESDLFVHSSEYKKGTESLIAALKLLEGPVNNPILKGMVLNDIGIVYFMQKDYENALKYYRLAIELRKKNGDKRALAASYNNIGSVYKNKDQIDSARFYYLSSYDIRQSIGDSVGISGVYNNLGVLAEKEKNFALAANFYRKAFDLGISLGDSLSALPMLINVGNAQWRSKDYPAAKKTLESAIKLSSDSKNSYMESKASFVLSRLLSETGDHKNAYEQLMSAYILSLKHSKSEELRITKDLEAKYENEKNAKTIIVQQAQHQKDRIVIAAKEKQQKLLIIALSVFSLLALTIMYLYWRQKNISKKLEHQKILLDKSNREKEVLLREIHHRVKNNLQIVSSLLNIQSRNIDQPEAVNALKESQSRIQSIALVHQKLYMNDSLETIDIPNYLNELCQHIINSFAAKTKVQLHTEFAALDMNINLAMQLGIIINELLTNSLKYAFEDSNDAEINISLQKADDSNYELKIEDNGSGIKTVSTKKSFGIRLVESIVQKINGSVKMNTGSNGTAYQIIFSNTAMPEI